MLSRVVVLVFLAAGLGCAPALAQSGEDLNFIRGLGDFRDVRRMLPDWLLARAEEHTPKVPPACPWPR